MAVKLEKSGELYFIRGLPDPPEPRKNNNWLDVALWVTCALLVAGVLTGGPYGMGWAAVGHTVKSFLSAVW